MERKAAQGARAWALVLIGVLGGWIPSVAHAQDPGAVRVEAPNDRPARFFLSHGLTLAPTGLLLQGPSDSACGRELSSGTGTTLSLDVRFWVFFVGVQAGVVGMEDLVATEWAARLGVAIPLGGRFSLYGLGWLGAGRLERSAVDLCLDCGDEPSGDFGGVVAGAAIGARLLFTRWVGMYAQVGLSDIFSLRASGMAENEFRRLQVDSGVVFAW